MTNPVLAMVGLSGGELLLILVVLLIFGLFIVGVAVAAVLLWSLRKNGPAPPPVESILPSPAGRPGAAAQSPRNMAGSQFHGVDLTGADFDDVNLSNARFHNVNLSNVTLSAAQMGGASFRHIGPPPDPAGNQERQRPVRFEEMMLCDSIFRKVDLSNVRIVECNLAGAAIDGVLVTDLLSAYRGQQGQQHPAP
jgi:Pentapeptide repeats (8 copies)